jgi:hypothetical protein
VSAAVYDSAIKKKPAAGDKGAAEKAVAAAAAGKGKTGSSGKGAAAAGGVAPAKAKKKPLNKKPLDESKVGPGAAWCALPAASGTSAAKMCRSKCVQGSSRVCFLSHVLSPGRQSAAPERTV